GHRNVLAKPEGVVLVDPGVVARLSAIVVETLEARAGILVEAEAFRAVVAGRLRAVHRALALATIEADQVSARSRPPHHAVLVDVAAADAEGGQRHMVDLRQACGGIVAQEPGRPAEDGDSVPDRAVDRARHHPIRSRARHDPLVLGRIDRLVWL